MNSWEELAVSLFINIPYKMVDDSTSSTWENVPSHITFMVLNIQHCADQSHKNT